MKLSRFLQYFTAKVTSIEDPSVRFTVDGKRLAITSLTFNVSENTWVIQLTETNA